MKKGEATNLIKSQTSTKICAQKFLVHFQKDMLFLDA